MSGESCSGKFDTLSDNVQFTLDVYGPKTLFLFDLLLVAF
jgi:hypothetical protein